MHDIPAEISENRKLEFYAEKGVQQTYMKSPQTVKERRKDKDLSAGSVDFRPRYGRDAKKAMTMSLLAPGMGQLYNGETAKGSLFLLVSCANLLLLTLLFFTEPLLNGLIALGSLLHTEPKLNVEQILEIVQTGRSVTLVYLALILTFVAYAGRDALDRAMERRRGEKPPRAKLTMPEATSGSYLAHFSIICTLVILVVFLASPPAPREQSTDIELVQDQPPPPPKKPEPPKPKQEHKPEPKLIPKKVLPQPPKPTPVAIAVPTDKPVADPVVVSDEPPPPELPPNPNGSENGTGPASSNASGGGGGGGDGEDFDFNGYLSEVQKKVKKNWFPPRGAESLSVTLKFKVLKDGSVKSIRLVKSSGVAAADDAAKLAVQNGAPYPALPDSAGDSIDIKFTFDYNVFNGKL